MLKAAPASAASNVLRLRFGKAECTATVPRLGSTVVVMLCMVSLAALMVLKSEQLFVKHQQRVWLRKEAVLQTWLSSHLSSDAVSSSNVLECEKSLKSENGMYTLVMQADSNVVLYRKGVSAPMWAAGKNADVRDSDHPFQLILQPDGNLVVYGAKVSKVLWASKTSGEGSPPYTLALTDNGNVVLSDSLQQTLWSTNTAQT